MYSNCNLGLKVLRVLFTHYLNATIGSHHKIKALKVLMEDDPEDFFSYNDIALNSKTLVPLQGGSVLSVSNS